MDTFVFFEWHDGRAVRRGERRCVRIVRHFLLNGFRALVLQRNEIIKIWNLIKGKLG